ncbi:Zn-dependent alcohol dehydrogenase [Hyphomonas adhaerens MHS-3]|uniref:Zn-dependent alcohol dehydrogenase n=2 Tax=Hyphomonas adhaerens TaxID=81029 RepID=A0A069E6T2_9PROT|nr:Zn-dependent alcohol dehydrogenase [Hyphomonas adhaerens MHS-3]
MNVLAFKAARHLEVERRPLPEINADSVLIRVAANGVCRTDFHMWENYGDPALAEVMPALVAKTDVMGHEIAGTVEEIGANVKRFKRGDRVVVPTTVGDGTCNICKSGHSHLCDSLTVPGHSYQGGYAEFVAFPSADRNLVHLPDEVGFLDASALGCRFVTAFHGVIDQAKVSAGEYVVVYGCGGVGLSSVNVAAAAGAEVIGVDINDGNLALAREMGAAHTINSRTTLPVEAIREITQGGAHVSIDALGFAETCVASTRSVRKRGRHLQLGVPSVAERGSVLLPVEEMLSREVAFISGFGMPAHRFEALLPMIASGRLTPARMIKREISLSNVQDVLCSMEHFSNENSGSVVVTNFC